MISNKANRSTQPLSMISPAFLDTQVEKEIAKQKQLSREIKEKKKLQRKTANIIFGSRGPLANNGNSSSTPHLKPKAKKDPEEGIDPTLPIKIKDHVDFKDPVRETMFQKINAFVKLGTDNGIGIPFAETRFKRSLAEAQLAKTLITKFEANTCFKSVVPTFETEMFKPKVETQNPDTQTKSIQPPTVLKVLLFKIETKE